MRRRVGSFLQSESAECGLVCLANVASFYDPNISLRYLRQQFPGSHRGLTLRQVADFARQLSFNARGLRAEPEHFVGLTKPAILHWGTTILWCFLSVAGVVVGYRIRQLVSVLSAGQRLIKALLVWPLSYGRGSNTGLARPLHARLIGNSFGQCWGVPCAT